MNSGGFGAIAAKLLRSFREALAATPPTITISVGPLSVVIAPPTQEEKPKSKLRELAGD